MGARAPRCRRLGRFPRHRDRGRSVRGRHLYPEPALTMEKTININVLGHRVWEYRRSIVMFVFVATVLSGMAALAMPPVYRATASLVPPGKEESGGIAKLMRGVTVPDIRIPASVSPADMFMAVLQSRRLREEVVNRFNLKKVYKRKFMQDAVNDLGANTKFKVTDAGT